MEFAGLPLIESAPDAVTGGCSNLHFYMDGPMRRFWHELSKRMRMFPPGTPLAVFLLCLAPQDAFAYVDPGSGLLLIQGLLAVVGGAVVFIKDPVAGCKRIWSRYFSKSSPRE
jgi:hypothetical protein